jgi:thymidylate synthase
LQNVKMVVENPRLASLVVEKPDEASLRELINVNLDPQKMRDYFENFLEGELRPDEAYTYGNRLRKYFEDKDGNAIDAVTVLGDRLKKDSEDRKAYFTLWDCQRKPPLLCVGFFQKI